MLDINKLKFDEKGLIPAVVVDAESKNVGMRLSTETWKFEIND